MSDDEKTQEDLLKEANAHNASLRRQLRAARADLAKRKRADEDTAVNEQLAARYPRRRRGIIRA